MSVTRRCESERLDRGHFCGLAVFTATDEMMGEEFGKRWATLRELLPFYGALGKSRRTPSWLVFRFDTIPNELLPCGFHKLYCSGGL